MRNRRAQRSQITAGRACLKTILGSFWLRNRGTEDESRGPQSAIACIAVICTKLHEPSILV